jgi:Mg-chelatase subunit ChlD
MNSKFLFVVILMQMISFSLNDLSLEILRSKSHSDQTGNLTPLVVALSSEDIINKVKGVDLILIVDESGSMAGSAISLVRESLKYLVGLMNEQDRVALVTFESEATIDYGFTQMTETNKNLLLSSINHLYSGGGTNIYGALEAALSLLKNDYTSSERIASMILLSDGGDNYYNAEELSSKFASLLSETGKANYAFTLHTFGFGDYHDADLMYRLSIIKDGGYFYISRLLDVNDAYLKIYGALSTVSNVNLVLTVQSNFKIDHVYGMDDMYKASLANNKFTTTLTQVIYGMQYFYLVFVDVPENTARGTKVLEASISPVGISAVYLWDNTYNNIAYEEYIKSICVTYYQKGYDIILLQGVSECIVILESGRTWIQSNYHGMRDWIKEYNIIIEDLNYSQVSGTSNLLSKIHELKTPRIGIHYSEENTYTKHIVDNSHNIDVTNLPNIRVVGTKIIEFDITINYYYFYLKEGVAVINNMIFTGSRSSFIIYCDDPSGKINITSLSDYVEYYYWSEKKTNIQNIVDFSRGGKFIFQKDFPYDFYLKVDGTRDITFNIEFLKLEINGTETIEHSFEIIAYILDEYSINNNYLPSTGIYYGTYDSILSLGKFIIKKEDIKSYLSSTSYSYLYVVVRKVNTNINIIYKQVEGQFIFVSMDYIYSTIPEGFYISSYLTEGQKNPHLYTLEGRNITIEFSSPVDILICKIIKYKLYQTGSEELYIDYRNFYIKRVVRDSKIFIQVINLENPEIQQNQTNNLIVSIFTNNYDHIAGPNSTYAIRYYINPINEEILRRPKATVILLGFTRYVYVRTIKIFSFITHFARIREVVYSEIIRVKVRIRYKTNRLRTLEDTSSDGECQLEPSDFENQIKYNCSVETNGEEISNVELEDDLDFPLQLVEVKDKTPLAIQDMNNLQNIKGDDIFDKDLYILDNATMIFDNDKLNITGTINDTKFNYDNLSLLLNTEDSDEPKNISCKVIKLNNENYTLQCDPKGKTNFKTDTASAFANLGNANLLINIVDTKNSTINEEIGPNDENKDDDGDGDEEMKLNYRSKKGKSLSTGGVVGIVLGSLGAVIITVALIVCLKKQPVRPDNSLDSNNNLYAR